jgi:hypothetical protein
MIRHPGGDITLTETEYASLAGAKLALTVLKSLGVREWERYAEAVAILTELYAATQRAKKVEEN